MSCKSLTHMHLKAFLGSCSPRSIPRSASDSSGPSAPSSNELGSETATGGVPHGHLGWAVCAASGRSRTADPTAATSVRIVNEDVPLAGRSRRQTSAQSTVPGSSCTPCQRSSPCPQDADRDDECREATQRRDVLERGVHRRGAGGRPASATPPTARRASSLSDLGPGFIMGLVELRG